MAIELNHTIVPAREGEASARWFTDLFGMPEPTRFGPFWQVSTANGVDLDFDTHGDVGTFTLQHYAFLVSEDEFDAILARVRERGMDHWADPGRRNSLTLCNVCVWPVGTSASPTISTSGRGAPG